jgi:predicted secreted acid phosphatase
MLGGLNNIRYRGAAARLSNRTGRTLAGAPLIALLAASAPASLLAAQCPTALQPRIPPSEAPVLNIDKHKDQLTAYQAGDYQADIGLVIDGARTYVENRVEENKKLPTDQMKRLAVVLDIDETSLSNWTNIKINNFAFIKGGSCTQEPDLACGFDAWILKAITPAIKPTLEFFNFAVARNAAVFFITGRTHSQRVATMANLDREGFQGWLGLRTRPDGEHGSIVPFKSGERAKIEAAGYKIIANIGDQDSDLAGDSAECGFKLPNPFYFIP